MRVFITYLVTIALGMVNAVAQSPRLYAEYPSDLAMERNAILALERALLDQNVDSVRYWLDGTITVQRKRRQEVRYLFSDKLRTLAKFYCGQYASVLEDMSRGRDYFSNYRPVIPYPDHTLQMGEPRVRSLREEMGVFDLWAISADRVLASIIKEVADTDEREFLSLYWMAMLNDVYAWEPRTPYSPEEVQQRAEAFYLKSPQHSHVILLRIWGQIYRPSQHGLGWSIQGGVSIPQSDLRVPFKNFSNMGGNLDYTTRRWVYGMNFRLQSTSMAADFTLTDSAWMKGGRVATFQGGFHSGFMLYDGPLFRFFPTLGMGAGNLRYYDEDDQSAGVVSVFPTAELNLDVKLNFKAQAAVRRAPLTERERWSAKRDAYYLLRTVVGFAPLGFGPTITARGPLLYFSIGFGGFTQLATHR